MKVEQFIELLKSLPEADRQKDITFFSTANYWTEPFIEVGDIVGIRNWGEVNKAWGDTAKGKRYILSYEVGGTDDRQGSDGAAEQDRQDR